MTCLIHVLENTHQVLLRKQFVVPWTLHKHCILAPNKWTFLLRGHTEGFRFLLSGNLTKSPSS